jgi:pSer/pThr/pTyr-binding forkhead associated (FHA) protein
MKLKLEKIEARIRELIEIRMVGLLPGQKIGQASIQQLAFAMQENIIEQDGTKTAPNIFTLIVPPDETDRWQDVRLLNTLNEALLTVGREADLEFAAPPAISVAADASLALGEVRIIASYKVESLGPTNAIAQNSPSETDENKIPESAFLIIDGKKVFPLNGLVINIGRRLENQLAIDDPRISRTHAQLRAIKGRYVVFDLNSTGGTFVNGQRTSQSILYPGDVISLAGFALVFGQDNPPPRLDLKETGPLAGQTLDRPTAILKTRPDMQKSKK